MGQKVTLRAITAEDLPVLLRWQRDPDVQQALGGEATPAESLAELQDRYQAVFRNALCFMVEYQGQPVGECRLQRMDTERVRQDYAGFDVRSIQVVIGEKSLWGQGLGSEAIHLLTGLAFADERADYVLALDVEAGNQRCRRAFEKNDYRLVGRRLHPEGRLTVDLLAKNPRLGFQAYAIHLFFDQQTESAIRNVWREMAESGVAPYLHQSANRPHITLSIYRALDLDEARSRLAGLAGRHAALPVSFPKMGIFPGARPVVFLAPLVTLPLLELQAAVCQEADDLAELPDFDHYRPGHWVPHCAVAMEFDGARLDEVLHVALGLVLPLQGQIAEIGLTEMRPVRHLGQWAFGVD